MKRLSNFTMSQILNLSDEREVVENCVNTLEDLSYFEKNCKALSETDGMIEGFTRVLKAGIVAEGDNLQGGSLFLDPPLLGLEGRISMLGAIVNISYYGDDSVKATLFHSPGLMACLVRILLMAGLGQEVSEENVITLDEGSRVAGAELPVAVIGAEAIRKEASDYEREGTRMDGVGVWVVTVILNISCCDEVRMQLVEVRERERWSSGSGKVTTLIISLQPYTFISANTLTHSHAARRTHFPSGCDGRTRTERRQR